MNSVRDEPRRSASVGSHHESGVELLSENAVPSPIILNRIAQDEPKSYTPSARKVYVRSTILSIIEINSAEQFFRAEVVLEFSFSHPEIEAFTEADLERDGFAQMNKIFESRFLNLIEEDHSEKWIRKDKKDDPCHVRIMHRFKGKFTERFELEKFPFDKQELTIRITASQPTTLFEFKINQEKPSIVMDDNQSAFILAEWTLVPGIVMKESRSKAKTSATGVLYPHMYISTYVKRNSMHFIYNYFVVLFLLTTLSGSAYSIPIDEPADRISVEVTLLLAVVAFKYVVSQNIPRVPYNTILDLYILSSFFFLSIVTIEVAVAGGTDFGQYDRPFALILGFVWIAMNLLFIYRAFDAVVMREIRAQPFIDAKIHNEQQDEKDEQDIVNPHHNPYLSFAEKMRTPTRRTLAKHASDSPLRRFDNENRSLHTKPKPLSQFVSPALVLYLVVTIGAGFFFGSLMRKSGNTAQPYFQSRDSTPVRRMVVPHSQRNSIAKQLAQEGAPVILTFEGLQHEWTAFSLWNPDYIQRKVQRLPSVYKGMNQTFLYFDDSKPLADSDLVDWKSPFHVEDLDSREFFRKIESSSQSNTSPLGEEEASPNMNTNTPDSKYHYYFSGDIDSVPSLSDDIGDTDFLAVTEEGKVINVWMGQSGVTAQAHYDSFHNFYVQITGEKRFYLVPPGNHLNMYLYPRSHPSYRQSQVDFQSFSSQRWPRLSGIPVYRADLKPGDVLYLPPYWFHHVVAIDNSMSVNVWCDSAEYTISSAIWQSPLPFEESWDTATRSQKVSAYILVLLTESLDGQGNDDGDAIYWKSSVARNFITDLKETRFDNIFHSNAHSHTISRHVVCSNYVPTLDHGHRLAESARSLSSKFKEIALPVRQLLLGNFVEDLILWSVGVDGMYDMLRSCAQS